ncbi:LGFP repeat-containing protein [Mycobacterium sp. JS623]|uniref:LGFP repeat-containing protein n=1 Tax=Mycobacterium sp. JS623 TaxID=212767 RepID=UPI00059CF963|nr:LGFP repeat-containing protein [Mycobacterium sp. JS623]
MTKRGMVGRGLIARTTIGLLSAAALLWLAPAALATPQDDADAAITAAWQAAGGDTGPLGPKDGGVYPAGDGFGQNFPGGKIFFTPATGAHAMMGAILDKYMSLGGPADGDLGFPTIDEGAGKAPDSRNTTFSAPDNPVIFWTPDTGARVVRGPINAAWDKLGGSAGALGVPSDDETYHGNLITQKFTGGEVSYDRKSKDFTTVPPELAGELTGLQYSEDPTSAINTARRAAGGPLGPLGAAQGEPYKIGTDGLGQNFAGGKIFFSPATGANVVTGQVLAKYESVGGPQGDLGLPASSEGDGGLPNSRITTFSGKDHPVIFWTPDYGAVIVRGAMNAAWDKLGGAAGSLGAPMADQTENGDVITQRFSGGVVSWDRSKNSFSTEPANLASQLAGLQVPGQDVPKAPASPQASDTNGKKWFAWSWWWLLAIIPVVVLAGLVAVAAIRNRRGHDEGDIFDDGDDEFGSSYPGDQSAEQFSGRYAHQGLGSPPTMSGDEQHHQSPRNVWGAPPEPPEGADEDDDDDTARERVATPEAVAHQDNDEDPDKVDTTPTLLPTGIERDPLTDTGRHARIEIGEPAPNGTALHLPLDDPNEAPAGYPIKADTKSGLYWAPGTTLYDDARAEIWFASEELARTNGFLRAN